MNEIVQDTTPTILIVDDNPNNIKIVALILRSLNYKIIIATNGETAISLVEKNKPDLVLLDVMMPEMDGFETCKIIKSKNENSNLPIIFITALNDTNSLVEGFEAGGVDYITKPFNKQELISRVNTHLDLKRTRDKLEKTSKHLKELNSIKDKMFSVIGHDLRSPLGSVKFSLEMLLAGTINPASDTFNLTINSLVKSTDEIFSLLENLLGWAKSESGNLFIIAENLELVDLVNSVYYLHKGNLNLKQIEFKNDIKENVKVLADMNTLKTVIRNLISNAIKFTPEKGTIHIYSETREDKIRMIIKDTGVGMDKETIPKLFSATEHISTYGTNRESGSGLGLVLCYDFIVKNNGTIWVESEPGKGSSFIIELPVGE